MKKILYSSFFVALLAIASMPFVSDAQINNPSSTVNTFPNFQGICQVGASATSGTTTFMFPASNSTNATCIASTAAAIPMATACTASNLRAYVNTACTTGLVVTVVKNGTPTALTVNTLASTNVVSDTTDQVSFAAADKWSISVMPQQNTETCNLIKASFSCQ